MFFGFVLYHTGVGATYRLIIPRRLVFLGSGGHYADISDGVIVMEFMGAGSALGISRLDDFFLISGLYGGGCHKF